MAVDEIYRTAELRAKQQSKILNQLVRTPEADLYAALAFRAKQIPAEVSPVEDLDDSMRTALAFSGSFGVALDPDSLTRDKATVELGKRIFQRWSRTLHDFACKPTREDAKLSRRLLTAITGHSNGTAIIAAVLAGTFAVSAPVAAIIAALVTKLVVAPAAEEVCKEWSKALKKKRRSR